MGEGRQMESPQKPRVHRRSDERKAPVQSEPHCGDGSQVAARRVRGRSPWGAHSQEPESPEPPGKTGRKRRSPEDEK